MTYNEKIAIILICVFLGLFAIGVIYKKVKKLLEEDEIMYEKFKQKRR
jgi:hypothetical protein